MNGGPTICHDCNKKISTFSPCDFMKSCFQAPKRKAKEFFQPTVLLLLVQIIPSSLCSCFDSLVMHDSGADSVKKKGEKKKKKD